MRRVVVTSTIDSILKEHLLSEVLMISSVISLYFTTVDFLSTSTTKFLGPLYVNNFLATRTLL